MLSEGTPVEALGAALQPWLPGDGGGGTQRPKKSQASPGAQSWSELQAVVQAPALRSQR